MKRGRGGGGLDAIENRRIRKERGRLRSAAPFGLVFRFVLVVFSMACAWLRRPSAKREGLWCGDSRTTMSKSRTCLCQAHAMVPNG